MSITVWSTWIATLLQLLPGLTDAQFYCIPEHRPVIWLNQTILTLGFTAPTWRCIVLILQNRKQIMMKKNGGLFPLGSQSQGGRSCDTKHFLSFVIILLSMVTLTPMMSEIAGYRVKPKTGTNDDDYRVEYCQIFDPVTIGISVTMALFWAFLACIIKNINESLNIVKELKYCAYVVAIHYLFYTIISLLIVEFGGSLLSLLYFIFISTIITYIICVTPLKDMKALGFRIHSTSTTRRNSIVPLEAVSSTKNPPLSRVQLNTARNGVPQQDYKVPEVKLELILKDQRLKEALLEHLTKEFSIENLLFILAINEMKDSVFPVGNKGIRFPPGNPPVANPPPGNPPAGNPSVGNLPVANPPIEIEDPFINDVSNLYNKLKVIYDTFISKRAPNEINISATTADPIHAFFRKNSNDVTLIECDGLYNRAYREIHVLIENDSLPRFIKSSLYKDISKSNGTHTETYEA